MAPSSLNRTRSTRARGANANSTRPSLGSEVAALARHSIEAHHFPRIARCLEMLPEAEIWWRPNETSNSVGNLVLHLSGNVRQWIISGLGGQPDRRQRDREFAERGPLPKQMILDGLQATVKQAGRVISSLTSKELRSQHNIQGFRVTGFEALSHVVEHFAFHTGQIIYVTKMKLQKDLGFTQLPGATRGRTRSKQLPVL